MAKKLDHLKWIAEIRGRSEVTNRQPRPDLAALYLMQFRPAQLQVPPPPRRRLRVTGQPTLPAAEPVKIIHAV